MSEIVSVIAVLISVAALLVAIWVHKRQLRLQERMVELEEAREKDRCDRFFHVVLLNHELARAVPQKMSTKRVSDRSC